MGSAPTSRIYVGLVPRLLPAFQCCTLMVLFQRATLKSWEEPGNEARFTSYFNWSPPTKCHPKPIWNWSLWANCAAAILGPPTPTTLRPSYSSHVLSGVPRPHYHAVLHMYKCYSDWGIDNGGERDWKHPYIYNSNVACFRFVRFLCSFCELHDQDNNSECAFTDRAMPPIWLRSGYQNGTNIIY